jgi:hypothetical protein
MARSARKNTNLVENLKEINYRFHTIRCQKIGDQNKFKSFRDQENQSA